MGKWRIGIQFSTKLYRAARIACLHAGLVNIPREQEAPEFRNCCGFILFEFGVADSYVQLLAMFAQIYDGSLPDDYCDLRSFVPCDLKISIKLAFLSRRCEMEKFLKVVSLTSALH